MVAASSLPNVASKVTDQQGLITREWRDFFLRLASQTDNALLAAELQELAARVAALEEGDELSAVILGLNSVRVFGTLESGTVTIQLDNDLDNPGPTYFYGTGPEGGRVWYRLYDAVESGEGIALTDSGYTVLGEVDTPADLPGSGNVGEAWRVLEPAGLYAWDGAAFTEDEDATGVVGFALDPIPDTGNGDLVGIERDGFGRVTGMRPVEAGTNINIDSTDPDRIVISAAGGGGEILVADGISAPPVMLTNEAEDDFIYGDA